MPVHGGESTIHIHNRTARGIENKHSEAGARENLLPSLQFPLRDSPRRDIAENQYHTQHVARSSADWRAAVLDRNIASIAGYEHNAALCLTLDGTRALHRLERVLERLSSGFFQNLKYVP